MIFILRSPCSSPTPDKWHGMGVQTIAEVPCPISLLNVCGELGTSPRPNILGAFSSRKADVQHGGNPDNYHRYDSQVLGKSVLPFAVWMVSHRYTILSTCRKVTFIMDTERSVLPPPSQSILVRCSVQELDRMAAHSLGNPLVLETPQGPGPDIPA